MRNIIILGMHRSGTSMVAGVLAAAGIYTGEKEELLSDQQDNPHGFWERRDVVALNDAILSTNGGSWFSPSKELPVVSAEFTSGTKAIMESMPLDRSCFIKDPRMILTWPLWKDVVDDAVLLFVYREPLSVAASLQHRNSFPQVLGLALWEYYNRLAMGIVQGQNALYISYESIKRNPENALFTLQRQLEELGVVGTRPLSGEMLNFSLASRIPRVGQEIEGGFISHSQRELESYCASLCVGENPSKIPVEDGALLHLIHDVSGAFSPLANTREMQLELDSISRICEERTRERDQSLSQLAHLESEHSALAEAHNAEVAQHKDLEKVYLGLLESKKQSNSETPFAELSKAYGLLLDFENSFLAGIWRFVGQLYKLLTLKYKTRSSYEGLVLDAQAYFDEFGLTKPPPPAHSKLYLLGRVVKYVIKNPAGSARGFSLPRLKRASAIFLNSNTQDLDVWIRSRFPDKDGGSFIIDPVDLNEQLDHKKLVFPRTGSPQVSIVIPVFNDYRLTKHCLASILKHSGDIPYEIIIGDDCSTDLTKSITDRVANITVARGEVCQGFLGNCNNAAQLARGKYVLFLNNDTVVCHNWLAPLVDIVERDPFVGIVGPKLLFSNGKLQEAGGIVWDDGSAWNYGRMDSPHKPEYNYVKEVDYISGACLLIRADLWQQLGGFDPRYMPAYYEDTDIAFEVRELGYKVVYQPLSHIVHYEGVSNGTDLNSGMKQYQVKNQTKFREKWQRQLGDFHFPNAQHVFQARDRSRHQRCILFIDHYVPHYDMDAGSRSTFMYIQLMLEMGYRVLFLGANFFPHQPYTENLQQLGVEVLVGEYIALHLDAWLKKNGSYIDRVYLHRPHIAEQVLGNLDKMSPRPKIIFFGHDLHYLRVRRQHVLEGGDSLYKSSNKWKKREYAVFDRVDKIYYPSQVEVDEIQRLRPDLDVRAIPLYVLEESTEAAYCFESSGDILFVGGFNHPPNVDGICWFVESVFPLVLERFPEIKLHVVGSNPSDAVQDLQCESVMVYGYLPDEELNALYRRVRQVVVPLRFGAGVKGKVLEAIQNNLPLVTTTVGAEGIPDAQSVMNIADSAAEFADSVIRLNSGDVHALEKLSCYSQWLQKNFSKNIAARIIETDFGSPLRE